MLPKGSGGAWASASLAILDNVPALPASRRLASAHAALGTRHILILGQAPRVYPLANGDATLFFKERQSKLSGSKSGSESAFTHFDPDTDSDPDPDGSCLIANELISEPFNPSKNGVASSANFGHYFPLDNAMRWLLRSKIHKATVTEANVDYIGSITIDNDLIERTGFWPGEKVLVVSNTTGQRLETYVIVGKSGSGVICMNGAAAHIIKVGEEIIVMGFELSSEPIAPTIVLVDRANKFLRYL